MLIFQSKKYQRGLPPLFSFSGNEGQNKFSKNNLCVAQLNLHNLKWKFIRSGGDADLFKTIPDQNLAKNYKDKKTCNQKNRIAMTQLHVLSKGTLLFDDVFISILFYALIKMGVTENYRLFLLVKKIQIKGSYLFCDSINSSLKDIFAIFYSIKDTFGCQTPQL